MEWLGQYIQAYKARFRNDVYLEDLTTTTETSVLVVDSTGLVSKSTSVAGDLTSIVAGTGLSGTSLTGPIPTLNVDASQTQITSVGTIGAGVWQGTTIKTAYIGDSNITREKLSAGGSNLGFLQRNDGVVGGLAFTTPTNTVPTLANVNALDITEVGTISSGVWRGDAIATPYIADDAITEDKLANTLLAEIDANTAKVTNVATNLTASTHVSQIRINSSDGDNVIIAEASGSIAGVMSVTHHDKLDAIEAEATADQSKSDIDGLAITTVGTIDTGVWNGTAIATNQQKHLATFDIRGYSTADGTNYEIPVFVTDNNAPFEHNTSAGSDGLTALAVTKLIKATGVVMPYAGTLKKWKGWATHSTTSGTCNIALFRYRPNASSASNVSLVLLDAVSHTPAANNTVIAIDETAFTDADIAAGDVIISGIKGDGSQITYFVSTLEIEWD